jgi:hypothetical protein
MSLCPLVDAHMYSISLPLVRLCLCLPDYSCLSTVLKVLVCLLRDVHVDRQTDRQTKGQIDRQTTDRQHTKTDRLIERQEDRKTEISWVER